MADAADTSANLQQTANDAAASARRAVPDIQPRGYCHNPLCEMDVTSDRLFCDGECEQEFERERTRGAA